MHVAMQIMRDVVDLHIFIMQILSPCDMNSLATADITLVDNTAG